MFHPARMTRVLVGGHKARMQDVIDALHKERAVHIEDYRDPTGTAGIGTPLEEGETASDLLVRTRGLLKALDAEALEGREMTTKAPAALLADAEAELSPVVEEAAGLRSQLQSMRAEIEHLRPFAGIDAELSTLTSLRSVQGYMGTVRDDPRGALDAAGVPYEAGLAGQAIIVAVPRGHTEAADRVMAEAGFSGVAVPEGAQGTPAQHIARLEAETRRAGERLVRAEQRLASHRDQWGPRLAALERHLGSVVDKTQVPLRFGVTDTTFHIEGWIPRDRANRVRNALSARFGDSIYFEELGDGARDDVHGEAGRPDEDHDHSGPGDEAPVKLRNKGLAKPFEFMLGLLGRPRYWELDPTKLMLIFFPLFFGLMVGDLLVGLAIMAFGFYLKKNKIFGIGGPAVGRALVMGGFLAAVVGLFVFGEALGIHFVVSDEALEEGEMSWEAVIYGKEEVLAGAAGFPTAGLIHKEVSAHGHAADDHGGTDAHNVTDDGGGAVDGTADTAGGLTTHVEETDEGSMFTLVPHGTTHLKAGDYVQLGYYSKVHDILALLIWSVIIAFVHLNLALLIGFRNVYVSHGMTLAIQEKASWIIMELGAIGGVLGLLGVLPSWAPAAGAGAFVFGLVLLWIGTQKVLGVGFVAVLETLGFVGNFLSYTRLAAIGASKAGMALAFAAIGFDVVGGGDIQSIAGWVVYLIGMVVITLLAILSGGLQSLRLQFVESFQKFYTGGGRPYVPFGRRAP